MQRHQIEMEYRIQNGVIQDAGKFEQQPIWTPYFYELVLHCGATESFIIEDTTYDFIEVTASDARKFPELKDADMVMLYNDDNGFVYGKLADQDDLDRITKLAYESPSDED